jgi:O-succinylbenzoate synthase
MSDAGEPGTAPPLPPPGPVWLSHGRALYDAGDFWGSHEAWERAWRLAPPGPREVVQGLIQAAASLHKAIVQDNPSGARRLAHRALLNIGDAPDGYLGLALDDFRRQLAAWRDRLAGSLPEAGTVTDLPQLAWSAEALARRLRVDEAALFVLEVAGRRTLWIRLDGPAGTGWGECRAPEGVDGLWQALTERLLPSLAASKALAPPELTVPWARLPVPREAAAGLEAALWDLYARSVGRPLVAVLGLAPRPVPIAAPVDGHTVDELVDSLQRLAFAGHRHALVPARPNADRRVLPAVAEAAADGPRLMIDLGEAYRMADIQVLVTLDGLGAALLDRPFPALALAEAVRLCRLMTTPVGLGGWRDLRQLETALGLHACDVVDLDTGHVGLLAAVEMAELAAGHRRPVRVASIAATALGALVDLALAAHPAASLPASFDPAVPVPGLPGLHLDPDGSRSLPTGLGVGGEPDAVWLAGATRRHEVFRVAA